MHCEDLLRFFSHDSRRGIATTFPIAGQHSLYLYGPLTHCFRQPLRFVHTDRDFTRIFPPRLIVCSPM